MSYSPHVFAVFVPTVCFLSALLPQNHAIGSTTRFGCSHSR